jgi:hypothetical protein
MYATAGHWWQDDLEYNREAMVLWNSSASCVQGNRVINGTMYDPGLYVDEFNLLFNSTDAGPAAIVLAGSRLRFVEAGHNLGGNHAAGNNSCVIAAFPRFEGEVLIDGYGHFEYRGTNFTGGFGCSGRVMHHGAYSTAYTMRVEGDVCAEPCKATQLHLQVRQQVV